MAISTTCFAQTEVLNLSPAYGTLAKVEELTQSEKDDLAKASSAVVAAQAHLAKTQEDIAKAHKFQSENWMEWQTWVVFDGGYITLRYHNSMTSEPLSK